MIKSFRCKETQALFEGGSPRRFRAIQSVAERKLTSLNNAASLEFLRSPPGNRLEALKGDRLGQYSIRINNQYPQGINSGCVLGGTMVMCLMLRLWITTRGNDDEWLAPDPSR